MLGQLDIICKKKKKRMKLYPYLTPYTKTNSKRISIGAKTKTLRRKYSKYSNLGYGNGFLAKTSKKKKKSPLTTQQQQKKNTPII